jgi:GDPmannose 4,6-dehydratase
VRLLTSCHPECCIARPDPLPFAFDKKSAKTLIEVDERYFRPTVVEQLLGDPTKAKEKLGWKHKYSPEDLVNEMVQADLIDAKKDEDLHQGGFTVKTYIE